MTPFLELLPPSYSPIYREPESHYLKVAGHAPSGATVVVGMVPECINCGDHEKPAVTLPDDPRIISEEELKSIFLYW